MTARAGAFVESDRFGEFVLRVTVQDPVQRLRFIVRDVPDLPDAVVGAALRRIDWAIARGCRVGIEDVGILPEGGISISVSRLEKRGGVFDLFNGQPAAFRFLWRGFVFEKCEIPAGESLVERFLKGEADPPMKRHTCGAEVEPGREYCDHCQSVILKSEIR